MQDKPYDSSTWRTGRHLVSGKTNTPDEVTLYYIDCPAQSGGTSTNNRDGAGSSASGSGSKEKGTILLIHGFPETSFQFRHIITPLSQTGYRVLAPDYRGAGYSSKPRDMLGYRKSVLAADLISLLDALKVDRVHVVGHDIGGMVAHSFASRYPERTTSVMWGECPQPGTKVYDEVCRTDDVWHFTFHWQADLPEALVAGKERMYLNHFYTRLSHRTDVWTSPVLSTYTDQFSQSGAMRCGMDLYRAFHADVDENKRWLAKHGKSAVPVCAFSGGQSLLAAFARRQTEELYENVRVVEVPESGHWVAEENPEGCVREIVAFVGEHA